jgi:hypothetical protein
MVAQLFAAERSPKQWQDETVGAAVRAVADARAGLPDHPDDVRRSLAVAQAACRAAAP